jgi:GxxExxY protein
MVDVCVMDNENKQPKFAEITGKIIGCAMTVHRALKNGFQERIYHRALAMELDACGIPFKSEFVMDIFYRNESIGTRRVDFLINDNISVEIKAKTKLESEHITQALNYLEVYNLEIGLLINFGEVSLNFKRLTNKKYDPSLCTKKSNNL